MSQLPTGTVTLLFTDIEGATLLLQQLGSDYTSVLASYRYLLRTAFEQHNGHEVDMQGDSCFVTFARATDALSAAVTAQRSLASHSWPRGVQVRVRMGLHTGEPYLTAEGYVGLDVHQAARIMHMAHGGQVLLSQTTQDLVEHDLPEGVSLRSMGVHRLKDVQRPTSLFQLIITGLPYEFPTFKSLDAHLNNLPIPLTPMIGLCTALDGDNETGQVLDRVASLLDKSLLRQREGEEPRFWMLETLREFALEALDANREVETVQRAHAGLYLALAQQLGTYPQQPSAQRGLEPLERDHENLRVALWWTLEQGERELALRAGGALWWFWAVRGPLSEGRDFLEKALAGSEGIEASVRAKALYGVPTFLPPVFGSPSLCVKALV